MFRHVSVEGDFQCQVDDQWIFFLELVIEKNTG